MVDINKITEENEYDIAIIGMACRFPGANSVDAFWRNLQAGVESVSFFSDEELNDSGIDSSVLNNPGYVKAAPVLETPEMFDAAFFGFSPREAQLMDPQQRLFLECAWQSLEDAGYDPNQYEGAISIFGGAAMNTYFIHSGLAPGFVGNYFPTLLGNDNSFLTTRVSYKLNLKGPSLTVQTACSTSLVAVHMACQNLLNGESDMALAGGVSVRVPQKMGHFYREGDIFTPDGHCRPFDEKAKGTIFGSGVGIVVLKRMEDALEDGDNVYAVIKGTAINNDGAGKTDYTAPSVESQADVITEAIANAGIEANLISYVEAHGTGTYLGDPIEIAALSKAHRNYTNDKGYCAVGSVKSNFGHLDAAAGSAGLIKTVLALKNREIPPTLHFEKANSEIDFVNSPFYVNNELIEWKSNGNPRRAGVSSLGVGGTNAHIILQEAPVVESSKASRPKQLLVLSAKTETALEKMTANIAEHLKQNPNINFADVAYTLQTGRRCFNYTRLCVCDNSEDAIATLNKPNSQNTFTGSHEQKTRDVVFMFPGGGAQYPNMGADLYKSEPDFRDEIDRCLQFIDQSLKSDVCSLLFPDDSGTDGVDEKNLIPSVALPVLFIIESALAKLWMSWGVKPVALIGHSLGEYVAACLAETVSFQDALKMVELRGRLFEKLPDGRMLSVPLNEGAAKKFMDDKLSFAAINGPELCVVAGPTSSIEKMKSALEKNDLEYRDIKISVAAHSQMIDSILDEFADGIKHIHFKPPNIPCVSNVTGSWIKPDDLIDYKYWVNHLRNTVQFNDGIRCLLDEPDRVFLEIGPGRTLSTLTNLHPGKLPEQIILSSMRHPLENVSDIQFQLITLGRLIAAGIKIDWSEFYKYEKRLKVPLPTYPFERKRHWHDSDYSVLQTNEKSKTISKNPNISDWFYLPSWKRTDYAGLTWPKVAQDKKDTWLIFMDEFKVGEKLSDLLEKAGQSVSTVTIGSKFSLQKYGNYTVDPKSMESYESLFEALDSAGKMPSKIIHLFCLDDVDEKNGSKFHFNEVYQERGFYSLFYIARSLAKQGYTNSLQMGVITKELHEVVGGEALNPQKTTILGPCRVIGKEFPNINCFNLDISSSINGGFNDEIAQRVLNEFYAAHAESIVAIRGKHRWSEFYEPLNNKEITQKKEGEYFKKNFRLRKKGVYLVTGGLGGIGLTLACYLAETVQAKLVLVGRSHFPQKSEWKSWLKNHDEKDLISAKIKKLMEIEKAGGKLAIFSADVSDESQMRSVIDQASQQFGSINGVIHCAGMIDDNIIQLKTKDSLANVLKPKVQGALTLNKIFQGTDLEFFVLCSSINSVLAPAGQVDYSAANAFLDAFARFNNIPTISINWPGWQEVGILADRIEKSPDEPWLAKALKTAITSSEGVQAFNFALNSNFPQIIVSPADFELLNNPSKGARDFARQNGKQAGKNRVKRTPSSEDAVSALLSPVESAITEIWEDLLGVQKPDLTDNFFDLGGSSLIAVQLFSRIEKICGKKLPLATLFEAPTIKQLAEKVGVNVKEKNEERWQPLVKIQTIGLKPPFFCTHGAGGNVLIYKSLAKHLGEDQPVYGLQAVGLDGKQAYINTVEEMAELYIKEIKSVQPEGPYYLGGYCMGGTIAFEMAQQLKAKKEEVALLALFESYNWSVLPAESILDKIFHNFERVSFLARNFNCLKPEEKDIFISEKIHERKRKIEIWRSNFSLASFQKLSQSSKRDSTLKQLFLHNNQATLNYQPMAYPGRITVFRPVKEFSRNRKPLMGLAKLTTGEVDMRTLPFYPGVLLLEPFVQVLAQELKECLAHSSKSANISEEVLTVNQIRS